MAITDLVSFQVRYLERIIKKVENPQWLPELSEFNEWVAKTLASKSGRKPFDRQLELIIAPQAFSLIKKGRKAAIIAAEMGTGKTQMSNDLLYLFHKSRNGKGTKAVFVASGAKHLQKMAREAEEVLGKDNIEEILVVKTRPKKRPVKFLRNDGTEGYYREVTVEEAIATKPAPGKITYVIISKDTGKVAPKLVPFQGKKCDKCGADVSIKKKRGVSIPEKRLCKTCGNPLYSYRASKTAFMPMAWKLKKATKAKTDKVFDFAIVDEVHEMQNLESQQSAIYHTIVRVSAKTVVMTGTLVNGYASSLFYILYPLIPHHFHAYGGFTVEKIAAFIDVFGAREKTSSSFGRNKISELPQISDRIVGFLAPYTTWMSVSDLGRSMPPLKEILRVESSVPRSFYADFGIFMEKVNKLISVKIREGVNNGFIDVQKIKNKLGKNFHSKEEIIKTVLTRVKQREDFYFMQLEHFLINNPWKKIDREIVIPKKYTSSGEDEVVGKVSFEYGVEWEYVTPKEERLLADVKKELAEGRRILLYGNYIKANELFDRLKYVLENNIEGIKVDVVPENLPAEKIEAYIKTSQADVLMVSQERVATGLDLVMFQTVMFYELNRKVRTVEQAKVRPWRPVGQDKEVRVYYYAYSGSQEQELIRTAQKMRASSAVNGKIVDKNSIARVFDYDKRMTEAMETIRDRLDKGDLAQDFEMLSTNSSPFVELYRRLLEENKSQPKQKEKEVAKVEVLQLKAIEKKEKAPKKSKTKPLPKEPSVKMVEPALKKDRNGQMYLAF